MAGFIEPNWHGDDNDILKYMSDFYKDAISLNQSYWAEADLDARFEAGDQTVYKQLYNNLPASFKKQFSFNRIRRIINMISGYQRRNRKSIVVVPVENGDQETADQFSKIIFWIIQQNQMLETISKAFNDALITGLSLLQLWIDYTDDPISGNLFLDHCSYNSFLIDPFFKKEDLSDCNAIWKRSYLSKKECISLLPDKKEEIEQFNTFDKDDKFQYMPEAMAANFKNLLTYDEFYYRDFRKQTLLVDTQTGETFEWNSKKDDQLNQFLAMYPQVTVVKQQIPTIKVAIVVEGHVMYNGLNPLSIDQYPFIPVFGYYRPDLADFSMRIQGVVRGLRDAQYLYNRRKAIELDILESQINSGWKYKENALVNPKDIFLTGQGRGLALKEDAQMSDVERIIPPSISPSMFQLSEMLAREVQEISGVNEELLGSAMDDKAGILSMLRQGAGLTTLQSLFDQLDLSQKLLGKLLINVIQQNFTPGKVERIIEQKPSQQFYNKLFGKYDAVIEEGVNTSTQRQVQFAQLLHLREIGIPIPDDVIIDAANIQNKNELKKFIEAQKEEAARIEKYRQQLEMQEQIATTKLANARAIADEGLGIERMSRVRENQALAYERKAEAVKDQQQGLLNLVKSLKEIDDIDISHLQKLITLSKIIKNETDKKEPKTDRVEEAAVESST